MYEEVRPIMFRFGLRKIIVVSDWSDDFFYSFVFDVLNYFLSFLNSCETQWRT